MVTGNVKECRVGGVTMAGRTTFGWYIVDEHWSRAGLIVAFFLVLLSPFLYAALGFATFLVFLQLPVYMAHQYEEHAHGSFKAFVNRTALAGRTELSDGKIFAINIVGVWGIDLCALFLAQYDRVTFGLVAPYLAVVNGMIHSGMAARTRRSNPGLWTALALFLPFGLFSIVVISRVGHATVWDHSIGLGAALIAHVITFASMGALAPLRASRRARPA